MRLLCYLTPALQARPPLHSREAAVYHQEAAQLLSPRGNCTVLARSIIYHDAKSPFVLAYALVSAHVLMCHARG